MRQQSHCYKEGTDCFVNSAHSSIHHHHHYHRHHHRHKHFNVA